MGSWPDPTPFELEDGTLASSLQALLSGAGTVLPGLLLVGAPGGGGEGSGPALAVRLARAWARTGRRVLLADLQLDAPSLHRLVGTDNEQGIADHFAFGTSLELLAIPVDEGAWSLVPAGPWAGSLDTLASSPAWPRLLRDCAARDTTLLAYLPADSAGLQALARAFGAVATLGPVRELLGVSPFSVVAAWDTGGPSASRAASRETAAAPRTETPDEAFERIRLPRDARAREQLIADLRYRQRSAMMAPAGSPVTRPAAGGELAPLPNVTGAAGVLSPEAAALVPAAGGPGGAAGTGAGAPGRGPQARLTEPPPQARIVLPPRPWWRMPLWWTVAVLVLLSLLAGSWHLVQARARERARQAAQQEAASALSVPLELPQPMPATPAADTVLAYVAALEDHDLLPTALRRVGELQAALPEARHFVVPVVHDEALFYRVVSGPVADAGAARSLLGMLLNLQLTSGGSSQVQQAPLAFLLGEYPTLEAADDRVAGLRRLEIPSYVMPLAGPPERFRVYAGGYAGAGEAAVMREILQSVGEPDVLVERVGRR